MSTSAVSYRSSVNQSDLGISSPSEARVIHSYGGSSEHPVAVLFHVARKSPSAEAKRSSRNLRVLRRLKGFLVELQGHEARVGFVENGAVVLYDLPAAQLCRAGINTRNQPFQMDEIETEDDDGFPITGYRYMPLAQKSDAFFETLNFNDERKRKRELILKEFGKTQS